MALNHYLVGGRVIMVATFTVEDPVTEVKTPTDPTTVTFKRQTNSGVITTVTAPDIAIENPAEGTWTYTYDLDSDGKYKNRVEGTGTCKAAAEDLFEVLEGMIA